MTNAVKKTKKSSAKRYGARYGIKLRKRVNEIERLQKSKHNCPKCRKSSVKRISVGLYECRKCSVKFAGKAYLPE
ncbi:MAG: 50S ribosomal protein L37ae [Candidatus Nanoarchaeia archaeon]|nr:50S ribosomal protein L37ae [Candidatus Nanoarchaeia archaeon]